MPFDEDLDEFLDVDEFADGAIYTPTGGSSSTVLGIFDDGYLEQFGGSVEDAAPTFLCKASSVPNLAQGDAFIIRGVTYESFGNEPDGTGMVRIRLEKQ
jgi:hypothetical protein